MASRTVKKLRKYVKDQSSLKDSGQAIDEQAFMALETRLLKLRKARLERLALRNAIREENGSL